MSRQKRKGTAFETAFVNYERLFFADSEQTIHRAALTGAADQGDVHGLYCRGKRIVVECKDHGVYDLPGWLGEAEREKGNADADIGVVVFHLKGRGIANMGAQGVLMTVDDFNELIGG